MWQVEVPMMASMWPGSSAPAAAPVTWASTLPTATTVPSRRPVSSAAAAVSLPATAPSWDSGWSSLAVKPAKSGCSEAR